jgi:hypothetical protein
MVHQRRMGKVRKDVGEGLREKEWAAMCRGHRSRAGKLKANDGGGSDQIEFDCSRDEGERGRERSATVRWG